MYKPGWVTLLLTNRHCVTKVHLYIATPFSRNAGLSQPIFVTVKPFPCPRTQQHVSFLKKRVLIFYVMLHVHLVPLVTSLVLVWYECYIIWLSIVNGIVSNNIFLYSRSFSSVWVLLEFVFGWLHDLVSVRKQDIILY